MAGLMTHANSGEVTLVSATAQTLLQYKAPANQRGVCKGIKIIGKQKAGGTDTPCKARLTRSSANFGTPRSNPTPGKTNTSDPETPQGTWGANFSSEPTSPTDAQRWWEVQPQIGVIEFWPPQLWEEIPGGTSLQIELTSATGETPTLLAELFVEE